MRSRIGFCRLAVTALALVPEGTSREVISPPSVVHISERQNGRLLVPVEVNGKKGCRFLLDTGATTTVADEKLARRIGMVAGRTSPVLTFAGEVPLSMGRIDRLSLGKDWIGGVEVLIADLARLFNLDADIEGILGQDVLSRFNYLLDRRGRRLILEQDDGLARVLVGTRVSFESRGGKICVPAANGTLRLILDSGNPYLVVYEDAGAGLRLSAANSVAERAVGSAIGRRAVRISRIGEMQIGDCVLRDVEVLLSARGSRRSEDGFLPLQLFDSIYVNNVENFLILNPGRNR